MRKSGTSHQKTYLNQQGSTVTHGDKATGPNHVLPTRRVSRYALPPHYSNCGFHKCHRWSVWLFCRANFAQVHWRTLCREVYEEAHLAETHTWVKQVLKSKQTLYFEELSFFFHIFNCLIFEEHLDNCFPDLLDWRQRASPGWKEWRATQGISLSSSPVIFVLAFLLIGDNYPALSMIDYDQGERCEAWEILPWREVCASPTVVWGKNGQCKMLTLTQLRSPFFDN